jgi:uncharacterized membrane protein YvlD (DUF360 family)
MHSKTKQKHCCVEFKDSYAMCAIDVTDDVADDVAFDDDADDATAVVAVDAPNIELRENFKKKNESSTAFARLNAPDLCADADEDDGGDEAVVVDDALADARNSSQSRSSAANCSNGDRGFRVHERKMVAKYCERMIKNRNKTEKTNKQNLIVAKLRTIERPAAAIGLNLPPTTLLLGSASFVIDVTVVVVVAVVVVDDVGVVAAVVAALLLSRLLWTTSPSLSLPSSSSSSSSSSSYDPELDVVDSLSLSDSVDLRHNNTSNRACVADTDKTQNQISQNSSKHKRIPRRAARARFDVRVLAVQRIARRRTRIKTESFERN